MMQEPHGDPVDLRSPNVFYILHVKACYIFARPVLLMFATFETVAGLWELFLTRPEGQRTESILQHQDL